MKSSPHGLLAQHTGPRAVVLLLAVLPQPRQRGTQQYRDKLNPVRSQRAHTVPATDPVTVGRWASSLSVAGEWELARKAPDRTNGGKKQTLPPPPYSLLSLSAPTPPPEQLA